MQRVAIYTRISSDRPDENKEQGLGVARQEADCRKLAKDRGFDVVDVIVDNNKSAYRRNKLRQGWEKVKALVEDGAIDGIVAWHTDRLYRHPSDLEEIIKYVEDQDLTIYTVTAGEMDLNTTAGRLVARLLGSVARNEVEHKAERQSRKMLQSAIDGRYSGGRVPLGYSLGPTKGTLVINPDEARVLREACSRLLTGKSLTATAGWAAKELGRPIQPVTLKTSLTSELITGFREHVPQAERDRWNAKRKLGLVSGEPKGTIYKAGWEAILDVDTSKAIRSLLNDPARRRQGRRPVESLLSSLLHCALCGSVLGYSEASYKCSKRATSPGQLDKCGKVAVSTRAIEGLMQQIVKDRLAKTDIRALVDVPEPLTSTQKERQRLEEVRSKFYDLSRNGQMPFEDLVKQTNAITREIEALDQDEVVNVRKRTYGTHLIDGAERWDELDKDERRQIIRAIFPGVIVYPTGRGHKSGTTFDRTRVYPVSVDAKFRNAPLPGRDRSRL